MSAASPTRGHIAFALILLKSKRPEVGIEDYIHEIRSAIIKRSRKTSVDSQHYIDGTRFWKLAYERMQAENDSLLDKIFVLEHNTTKVLSPPRTSLTASKRRSEACETPKANIQTKRRKVEPRTADNASTMDINLGLGSDLSGCCLLLRSFYDLRSSMSKHNTDASMLCRAVKIATYTAGQAFEAAFKTRTNLSQELRQPPRTTEFCSIWMKIWMSILQSLRDVERLNSDMRKACSSDFAILVQILLGLIQQYCLDEADDAIKSKKRRRTKSTRSVSASNTVPRAGVKTICEGVSKMMCQMLTALDLDTAAHCSILEAFICSLFDHVGSSMSLLVFAESGAAIEKQMGVLPPCGLPDVAHIDSETAILTSQLASPYLVLVFQRVMEVVSNMSMKQQNRLLDIDEPSGTCSTSASAMTKVKQRLQNTLLRGVFGDDDAAFTEAFDRPLPANPADMEKILTGFGKESNRSEWFIGQVWEHLGWDILAAE